MRCLYCGEKLPLLKRLSNSHFCSSQHQQLFQKERDQVGLERLLDARAGLHVPSGESETAIEPAAALATGTDMEEVAAAASPKQLPIVAAAHFVIEGAFRRPPQDPVVSGIDLTLCQWGGGSWMLNGSIVVDFCREPRFGVSVAVPVSHRTFPVHLVGGGHPTDFKTRPSYLSEGLPQMTASLPLATLVSDSRQARTRATEHPAGSRPLAALVSDNWQAPTVAAEHPAGSLPLATLVSDNWQPRMVPAAHPAAVILGERTPEIRFTASGLRIVDEGVRGDVPASHSLAGLLPLAGATARSMPIEPCKSGGPAACNQPGIQCQFDAWSTAASRSLRPTGLIDVEQFEPTRVDRTVSLETPAVPPAGARTYHVGPPPAANFQPVLPLRAAIAFTVELASGAITSLTALPVRRRSQLYCFKAGLELTGAFTPVYAAQKEPAALTPGDVTGLSLQAVKAGRTAASIGPLGRMLDPVIWSRPPRFGVTVRFGSTVPLPVVTAPWKCSTSPAAASFTVKALVVAASLSPRQAEPNKLEKQIAISMPRTRNAGIRQAEVAIVVNEGMAAILPRLNESMAGELIYTGSPFKRRTAFTPVFSVWRKTPSEVRWLVMALPVIAGFMMRPDSGSTTARATAEEPAGIMQKVSLDRMWSQPLQSIRLNISRRAAIEFSDDFRTGLSNWDGTPDWSRTWTYDSAGFVRTGSLAFFQPTMTLKDYRVEFVGQIEKKALGWTVRSQDLKNYYAFKIMIIKPGPLPTAVFARHAVIQGREERAVQLPIPISVRNDTIYHIRVNVRGSEITTFVQDHIVDSWTDGRLKTGGIGFFSSKGEQARLRSVAVSHQYDALGRLCAYLAPGGIQTNNGSVKQ